MATNSQKQKQKKKRSKKKSMQSIKLPVAVSAPSAKTVQYVAGKPKITQNRPDCCRIAHREMVDVVKTPSTLGFSTVLQLPLNPGIDETFSWLSNIAINWERYKFHRLSFHYLTRVASTNTGSVILSPDYDPADAKPVDEITALSYADAREDVVWKDVDIFLKVPSLDGGRKDHFVRTGPLGPNLDVKSYDSGTLFVCVDATVTSTLLGKLFVDYDVEFFTPQLPPTGDPLVGSSVVSFGGAGNVNFPLGSTPVNSALNTLGNVITSGGFNNLTFLDSVEDGLLTYGVSGTGLGNIIAPTVLSGGGTVAIQNASTTNAALTSVVANFILRNFLKGDTLQMPTLSAATTFTGANSVVSRTFPDIL
jgi:hypothetical protein